MENRDIIQMYNHNLHTERISTGRIAAITTFIIAPIFYLKDIYMTQYIYSTFFWRLIPMVVAVFFLALSYSKYRHNYIVIKYAYLAIIYGVLIMMFGVFYMNYGTSDGRFNSFLIAGMITTILIIQLFSTPIRKYIVYFSMAVIVFFVITFLIKGGDVFIVSNLINPTATIVLIAVFSYINEKKSFSEFKSKVLLELKDRELTNEIAYRRALEEELKDEVWQDALTSIYNRRAAEKILSEKMVQLNREAQEFSLVFIDLDDLKKINDSRGHDEGDKYIVSFTETICELLDSRRLMYRVGGDEFIIFFEGMDAEDLQPLMERMTQVCLFKSINFSYGVASSDDERLTDLDSMIKEADLKMYNQKRRKKQSI